MINALIIIPYPELHAPAAEMVGAAANPNIHCQLIHAYGTDIERLLAQRPDIVLARGLTEQAIKRTHPELAVLEINVTAYDMLRAIDECRERHGAKKIAVITSASITLDFETLEKFVPVKLRHFTIRNESQILAAINKAEKQRCDAIVGGLTGAKMAAERGWKTTFIRTSIETLRIAITETIRTALVMHNERAKHEISRTILENSKEGILFFDQRAKLTLHNPRARQMLDLPLAGKGSPDSVTAVFADPEMREAIRRRREVRGLIRKINNQVLLADIVPVRLADQDIGVICTLQQAGEIQAAETKIRKELSQKGLVARYSFDDIAHASDALASTIATARKYGEVDANVLIIGETGTGKELFAQSIHNASARSRQPFVALNCAAFPETLLESELFGYVPGAFSGAAKGGKTGLFELAHGGTMFLDEIGEMPLNLQATLLRALQEGEIRKIGDDRVIPVNVRVIAATNRDLRRKVREGRFRMDLLYRLDVLSLNIPPLRQRRDDIAHIAQYYFRHYCRKYHKPHAELSAEALAAFTDHDWPGNTRELKNVCERLAVLGAEEPVNRETAERVLALSSATLAEYEETEEAESLAAGLGSGGMAVADLMQLANSLRLRKADIAGMLGISRTTLWRRTRSE